MQLTGNKFALNVLELGSYGITDVCSGNCAKITVSAFVREVNSMAGSMGSRNILFSVASVNGNLFELMRTFEVFSSLANSS